MGRGASRSRSLDPTKRCQSLTLGSLPSSFHGQISGSILLTIRVLASIVSTSQSIRPTRHYPQNSPLRLRKRSASGRSKKALAAAMVVGVHPRHSTGYKEAEHTLVEGRAPYSSRGGEGGTGEASCEHPVARRFERGVVSALDMQAGSGVLEIIIWKGEAA